MNYDDKCQMLMIGDSTVGKTSLLLRYTEDKYSSQYLATVGIDFFTKDETFNGKIIRLKIWDTAGQERYKSLAFGFYKNSKGIILVFDVANKESFESLQYWLQTINANIGDNNNELKMMIIANKIDLPREVSKEEIEKFSQENHIPYYETSAKTGVGISDAFRALAGEIVLKEKNRRENSETVKLGNKSSGVQTNDNTKCKCGC